MLDLLLLRKDKGGNTELLFESQKKRFKDTTIIDQCIEIYEKWRERNFFL